MRPGSKRAGSGSGPIPASSAIDFSALTERDVSTASSIRFRASPGRSWTESFPASTAARSRRSEMIRCIWAIDESRLREILPRRGSPDETSRSRSWVFSAIAFNGFRRSWLTIAKNSSLRSSFSFAIDSACVRPSRRRWSRPTSDRS